MVREKRALRERVTGEWDMTSLINAARRFNDSRSGATAIEYAIIAAFIAIGIIGAVGEIGSKTNDSFEAARAGFGEE